METRPPRWTSSPARPPGDINFQLNRTTVVKGIIYNANGTQPIPRAGINYSPADNQGSYSSYCADDNGRFSISMPPGSYKFFVWGSKGCGSDPNLALGILARDRCLE